MASPLGTLIRRLRQSTIDPLTGRAFTQEALGRTIGISGKTIEALENGRVNALNPEAANRLAQVFDVSVEGLVQAMGYRVGSPGLAPDESELVQVYRRVPTDRRPGLLHLVRLTAQGLVGLDQPEPRPRGRERAG